MLAGLLYLGVGVKSRRVLETASAMPSNLVELRQGEWRQALAIDKRPSDIALQELPRFFDSLEHQTIKVVAIGDTLYPETLSQISHPPAILFAKGNLKALSQEMVAIVGSRKPTRYGRQVVEWLISSMVGSPVSIVSGLALGIDGLTHQACLSHGVTTVACIGSGLDRITPSSHQLLARGILDKGGVILSEYPLGTEAMPYHFPARNRIIAGLSQSVVVVEGAKESGSLITAEFAKEYGRQVYAVPGSIFSPMSEGPHQLIADGARLLDSPMRLMATAATPSVKLADVPPGAQALLTILSAHESLSQDELAHELAADIRSLQATLSQLELLGYVEISLGQVRLLVKVS